ncbi:iron ABC transporter substrate-binding protein [Roseivivax halodurans]
MIMRSLLAFVLLASPAAARTITDSAGRIVDIPDEIETVFAAGPPASVLVYVIAPETLTGWPRALRPEERDYIAEPYRDLPETGRLTGRGGEANLERVLEIAPDLILDFGSVRDTYVDLANRVQEQMDIPYVLIDGRFENTPDALRLLGEVLGKPERGERLARDAEETFARIDTILAEIPEEDRPRTYLARGPDGLETGMTGSINTEIIERAGGVNVADDGGRTQGLVQVSPEQVIVSDPEIVVTWDPTFYGRVWSDPLWAGVDAVRSGQVFLSPTAPFGWIDRPPSLNRMMGLRWMARLFYPDRWEGDLREETAEFYKTWYRVDLGDAELDRLLEWAEGRPPE